MDASKSQCLEACSRTITVIMECPGSSDKGTNRSDIIQGLVICNRRSEARGLDPTSILNAETYEMRRVLNLWLIGKPYPWISSQSLDNGHGMRLTQLSNINGCYCTVCFIICLFSAAVALGRLTCGLSGPSGLNGPSDLRRLGSLWMEFIPCEEQHEFSISHCL